MNQWRLITDDAVSASFGLAADEVLAQRVGQGKPEPTLRLYTYAAHCALVGRFQNIENELHRHYCEQHNIPINRRPTGGGAIIMGADQLGVALTIPGRKQDTYSHARELMGQFSEGIVRGLQSLGVNAEFRRKNDIEVEGRKIAGLGIHKATSGGLLFHASLLVDLDIELMLNVLNTPFEKISDKEISTVSNRISTVRKETGRAVTLDEVRQVVAQGYKDIFEVDLIPGTFTPDECRQIEVLEHEKYLSEDWVFQTTEVPDTFGEAKIKTPAGLLDVRTTLAGSMVKAVYIAGDFFAEDKAIADLEGSLRWHTSDPSKIEATLEKGYQRWHTELNNIPLPSIVEVVNKSIRRAQVAEKRFRADPYGCFVTPGGGND